MNSASAFNTVQICTLLMNALCDQIGSPKSVTIDIDMKDEIEEKSKRMRIQAIDWSIAKKEIASILSEFSKWSHASVGSQDYASTQIQRQKP